MCVNGERVYVLSTTGHANMAVKVDCAECQGASIPYEMTKGDTFGEKIASRKIHPFPTNVIHK